MQYQPNSSLGPHGYLLSVLENILAASKHGLLKDKVAIIQCRQSIEQTRSELLSRESKDLRDPSDSNGRKDLKGGGCEEQDLMAGDDIKDSPPEGESAKEAPLEQKPAKVRKVSDVFRNLFKLKPSKEAEEGPEETESSATLQQASDKSMVQTSVNLQLGQKTKKIRLALAPVPEELECLEPYFEDSFTGGSCLKVNPSDRVCPEHRLVRLFHTDFQFDGVLVACLVTKNLASAPDQSLNVELRAIDSKAQLLKIVLTGNTAEVDMPGGSGVLHVPPVATTEAGFKDIQKYVLLHEPGFYVPVENSFGWNVRSVSFLIFPSH